MRVAHGALTWLSGRQVYGKGTETLVMDEDAQTLEARAPPATRRRAARALGLFVVRR